MLEGRLYVVIFAPKKERKREKAHCTGIWQQKNNVMPKIGKRRGKNTKLLLMDSTRPDENISKLRYKVKILNFKMH